VAEEPLEPAWISKEEAARRLGMSESWLVHHAEEAGITVQRRGNPPGVGRRTVEGWIAHARINPSTI
jgi:hypothetical protein